LTSPAPPQIRILDLRKLNCLQELKPEADSVSGVTAAAFDASGQYLASGSASGTVAVWGVSDWAQLVHRPRWHGGKVTGAVWGANAGTLVTASDDKAIKVAALQQV
jgi:WD40 repeat protein